MQTLFPWDVQLGIEIALDLFFENSCDNDGLG